MKKKHLCLTALVALWGFGCQNQSINESMATDGPANASAPDNNEAFMSVPLTAKKICDPAVGQSCFMEIRQLQLRLTRLNLIPIPKEGEQVSLSVEQATTRYKEFVTAHAGEPIVSVFRQVYARVLLNQYGVLTSKNHALIQYYTRELTDENSLDFATLAKAANALQGKLSEDAFASLVNTTNERAQAHQKALWQRLAELNLDQKTAKGEETSEAVTAKIMMERINKSTLRSDLQRLDRLQAGLKQSGK